MIVITGASDGLGLELAKLYKSDGKTVVNISRHASKYADVNITHDLQKGNEVHASAEEVFKLKEPLEAIVNCAGVFSYQDIGRSVWLHHHNTSMPLPTYHLLPSSFR